MRSARQRRRADLAPTPPARGQGPVIRRRAAGTRASTGWARSAAAPASAGWRSASIDSTRAGALGWDAADGSCSARLTSRASTCTRAATPIARPASGSHKATARRHRKTHELGSRIALAYSAAEQHAWLSRPSADTAWTTRPSAPPAAGARQTAIHQHQVVAQAHEVRPPRADVERMDARQLVAQPLSQGSTSWRRADRVRPVVVEQQHARLGGFQRAAIATRRARRRTGCPPRAPSARADAQQRHRRVQLARGRPGRARRAARK